MGFRQGFIPLQSPQGPSILDTVGKYRNLQQMAQQRREGQRMRELAISAIDPATGRVDEDAFLTAVTAEFPLRAREIGLKKLSSATQAAQANANLSKTVAEARYKNQQALTEKGNRELTKQNKLTELKAREFIKKDPMLQDLMGEAHKDVESYNKFSSYLPFKLEFDWFHS